MNKSFAFFGALLLVVLSACQPATKEGDEQTSATDETAFNWNPENFSDKKIIRYQIPGFDKLSLQQKKLVYYLTQAGLSGRDIMYDMNYRHNLEIRKALDKIAADYKGDKNSEDWKKLVEYSKNVWFSNGIHHHYSTDKFIPEFSQKYFESVTNELGINLSAEALAAMFDPAIDNKKVNLDPDKGLLKGSAVNFYDPDITESEVDAFYASIMKKSDTPISYGLNSKMVRTSNGGIREEVYKVDGLYGAAIEKIIYWLEKAKGVAENEKQAEAFGLLIDYYKTGSLEKWDEYNIAWVETTEGDVDYINGFIEVYNDPKGYRGSYETVVEITDFDASERMKVVADNVQWFEDNSTIMDEHKKKEVKGVTYKVVTVAGEAGDASPSTPIGVNLPNANWIRKDHGSKSVSLGNIIEAYEKASGPGMLAEFAYDEAEIERAKKYGSLADKLHTALHEVVGHASGQINPGVGTPKETMKSYASTLEEARADLVGLYFLMDEKLIELGLVEDMEVGKTAYDDYIMNGMMTQLRRIQPGKDIEESHMRNRQLVASWAFEKGKADNVVERVTRDGKTYFKINDYQKLRGYFGDLLREIQRIKSEGDYEAGRALVENYGVKVDQALHAEVLERAEKLNIPPYGGFINPKLVPITDANGEITDIKVEYPDDFTAQMLEYAKDYSFLK
ncbi:MAG: dihydrofolate reductase [Saprospiraceae bacterium]|nr:dihydrofolate reductase [Saprospiraceae bacterium]MCB9326055.1 dihydrofolate reductase [Lewinellaceae bacterium]